MQMRAAKILGWAGFTLALFLGGCGRGAPGPEETAVIADLIVLGETRMVDGHPKLFAKEVLKGHLGKGVEYGLGEEIPLKVPLLPNMSRDGDLSLLFYQENFGSESWMLMASGSGPNAKLVQALRDGTFRGPEPRFVFSWEKNGLGVLFFVAVLAALGLLYWLSGILDRRWLAVHPNQRHFRWGYFQALGGILSGVCWLIALIDGIGHPLSWFFWLIYGVVAPYAGFILIKDKKRWAWLFLTAIQLNLVNWVINYVYGKNRWQEFVD